MECGNWFPIQKSLSGFKANRQVVWIIFDCDRDKVFERKVQQMGTAAKGDRTWSDDDSEEDKEAYYDSASSSKEKYGTIFTYAAKLGSKKTQSVLGF